MRVRLTQLDGKLPNLALMKLAAYHRARGDEIVFSRTTYRDFEERAEDHYGRVYASAIFTRSLPIVERFRTQWPGAIVGGSGLGGADDWNTVERYLGIEKFEEYDYSIYPGFAPSIGFTMRGCRLSCGFCVVPGKEGRAKSASTIADIWRGPGHPKQIVLLDNDFFGQPPREYEARIAEIVDGDFEVCFNQGINVRLLRRQEHADALFRMKCKDGKFSRKLRRCIYTAFDNADDEAIFRRGIEMLMTAGFKGDYIMVYMLVGFDPAETWDKIFRRLDVMREYNIRVYPMVYEQHGSAPPSNALDYYELKKFQKWIVRRYDRFCSFEEFKHLKDARNLHDRTKELDLFGLDE